MGIRLTDVTFVLDGDVPRRVDLNGAKLKPAGKLASFVLLRASGDGLRASVMDGISDTGQAGKKLGSKGGMIGVPMGRHGRFGLVFRATRVKK